MRLFPSHNRSFLLFHFGLLLEKRALRGFKKGTKMKSVLLALSILSMTAAPAFADRSCQSYAETIALRSENQSLVKEVAPEKLTDAEAATLQVTTFLDKDGNETGTETGIYEVGLGVMEECMDSLIVVTAVMTDSSGKESCHLIKIEAGSSGRDCG
jgi:hypothetical protein